MQYNNLIFCVHFFIQISLNYVKVIRLQAKKAIQLPIRVAEISI